MAAATVVIGVVAHVLGGGGATLDCVPLLAAALLGVATTLTARRADGGTLPGAMGAAALLGVGQFSMHVALSVSLSNHADVSEGRVGALSGLVSSFSCGLVIAHTVATALLTFLMLGAHRSAEVAFQVLIKVRQRVRRLLVPPPPDEQIATVVFLSRVPVAIGQRWRYSSVRSRRGPPLSFGY